VINPKLPEFKLTLFLTPNTGPYNIQQYINLRALFNNLEEKLGKKIDFSNQSIKHKSNHICKFEN
jgi:hypothetical protein